jgi:hypothetical protein
MTYISKQLRDLVRERARSCCEYCLIHAADAFLGCEPDHIIAEKHGGPTDPDNLAYACMACNRHKGTDLGSVVRATAELVRFFNPRIDRWADHFRLDGARVEPLSDIGEVTARILGFNSPERILERVDLIDLGRYPGREPDR